ERTPLQRDIRPAAVTGRWGHREDPGHRVPRRAPVRIGERRPRGVNVEDVVAIIQMREREIPVADVERPAQHVNTAWLVGTAPIATREDVGLGDGYLRREAGDQQLALGAV